MLNFWSHNLLNGIIFTIKASPETATVQINGKVRNSVAVAPGATVSWSVSASGYYTQTGSQTVKSSTTKTIELKKVPYTVNQKLLEPRPCPEQLIFRVPAGSNWSWKLPAPQVQAGKTQTSGRAAVQARQLWPKSSFLLANIIIMYPAKPKLLGFGLAAATAETLILRAAAALQLIFRLPAVKVNMVQQKMPAEPSAALPAQSKRRF